MSPHRLFVVVLFCIAGLIPISDTPLGAQKAPTPDTPTSAEWRLTVTIFRSPGTGLQLSRGALAVFVAHYPTIFPRDGERRTTHFLRVGVAGYLRAESATSPYVSLSIAPSLSKGWSTSGLLDVGLRRRFTRSLSGQLGAALLYAPTERATRINPTLGLGVSF